MYLVFDTETTGFPARWDAPCTDTANWPRLVQIAWVRAGADGQPLDEQVHIVRPFGFSIPKDAERVHGISTAQALLEGSALGEVLDLFSAALDQSSVIVAHNIAFDECVVAAEFAREGRRFDLAGKSKVCTMKGSTDYCRLPGRNGYKYPTLAELYYTLFRRTLAETHRADADVRSCLECFFELKRRGVLPAP
jgi:DNA polymerase III epsilon subunit-like protein